MPAPLFRRRPREAGTPARSELTACRAGNSLLALGGSCSSAAAASLFASGTAGRAAGMTRADAEQRGASFFPSPCVLSRLRHARAATRFCSAAASRPQRRTKKVGIVGKYGTRFGASLRKCVGRAGAGRFAALRTAHWLTSPHGPLSRLSASFATVTAILLPLPRALAPAGSSRRLRSRSTRRCVRLPAPAAFLARARARATSPEGLAARHPLSPSSPPIPPALPALSSLPPSLLLSTRAPSVARTR